MATVLLLLMVWTDVLGHNRGNVATRPASVAAAKTAKKSAEAVRSPASAPLDADGAQERIATQLRQADISPESGFQSEHFRYWQVIGPFEYASFSEAFDAVHTVETGPVDLTRTYQEGSATRHWQPCQSPQNDVDVVQATAPPPSGRVGVYYAVCWGQLPGDLRRLRGEFGVKCGFKYWNNGQLAGARVRAYGYHGFAATSAQGGFKLGWNELLVKLVVPAEQSRNGKFHLSLTTRQDSFGQPTTNNLPEIRLQPPDGRPTSRAMSRLLSEGAPQSVVLVDLGGEVKLEMVLIPAGEFLMGTPGYRGDEEQHPVRITKPFYLGKYLVTKEQWEAVMRDNPSDFKGPKNPVDNVSWNDCQQFLAKLNRKVGPGGGNFELPTEAQWEYACRAGSATRYCFGNEESGLDEYAWYGKSSGGRTQPVGKKKPNAWGFYDMHGNVYEWCQDWYDNGYYTKSPTDDPTGPSGGAYRVIRGGCCSNPAGSCRSASRGRLAPDFRRIPLGLRVARVAE